MKVETIVLTMTTLELENLVDTHDYKLEEVKLKNNRVRLAVGYVPPHMLKVIWDHTGKAFEYNEQERCDTALPDYNLL